METIKLKLSEITLNVTDGEHGTVKNDKNGNYYLLSCKNIKNGEINITCKERMINENSYNKIQKRIKLEKNDVLITTVGTIGEMAIVENTDINFCFQRSVGIIKPNINKINPYFLYYSLKNEIKQINTLIKGAVQKCLFINDMKMIELKVPSLKEQNKIANILKSIDDKIKLNKKINRNLFEIASNLINKYFTESYNNEQYIEVINFIKGRKPKDIIEHYEKGYEKYLTIACLNGEENNYANIDKMLITEHDILMVMDGASSGNTYFSSYGVVGSTLSKVEIINDSYIPEYIFFTLKKYRNYIQSQTTGSAIPHTNKDVVLNLEIPKIDLTEQLRFKSILDKILHNNEENISLSQLRDTLLPKLMNGEIDLSKVEI